MGLVHLQNEKKLPPVTLVLGGAASGKSQIAESLIENSNLHPVYIATGRIWDEETKNRVSVHKNRRNSRWRTVECPLALPELLPKMEPHEAVLIDCATMWLTNHLVDEIDITLPREQLFTALATCAAPVVIVSNEVGQGIVPENKMARAFREMQGRFNIEMAARADVVIHVVAGLPNLLKGELS